MKTSSKEKQVVLEEIKMEEDNPESLAHEVLTQGFWRGHPSGLADSGHQLNRAAFHA